MRAAVVRGSSTDSGLNALNRFTAQIPGQTCNILAPIAHEIPYPCLHREVPRFPMPRSRKRSNQTIIC